MFDKIDKFIKEHVQIHLKVLLKQKDIVSFITEFTKNISDITLKERLFLTHLRLTEYPICEICKKEKVRFLNNRFSTVCKSKECGRILGGERMKQTKLKKYGCVNTCTKEILKQRYGVVNISQLPGVAEKISNTHKNKSVEQLNISNDKRKKTNLEKYGAEHYLKTNEGKIHVKETCLKKYGCTSVLMLKTVRDAHIKQQRQYSFKHFILTNSNSEPLFTEEDYIKANDEIKLKFKCKLCKNEYYSRFNDGHITSSCPFCYPRFKGFSKIEKEVLSYVKSILPIETLIQENVRILPMKGKDRKYEIDIYIPSLKIGIEINGMYYHCDKPRNYHYEKYKSAKELDIQLITITDNEWINKNKIWKSIIKHKFNLVKYRIMARKCLVKEIDNNIARKFLNKYHLQSADKSSVKLGLFFKTRLVAVMTFGKSRFNLDKTKVEMIRFCTVNNFIIQGAAGKLLSYYKTKFKPDEIITYANCNYSNGNLYNKLGFIFKRISSPNYVWYNNNQILTRYQTQKHRLKSVLNEKFDISMSESQNMFNNGWRRYFDCGNLIFEWKANSL